MKLPDNPLNGVDADAQIDTTTIAIRAVALTLIAGIVYLLRPLFHGLLYTIAYSPVALLALGVPLLAAVILFLLPSFGDSPDDSIMAKGTIVGVVFIVMLTLGIAYAIPAGMVENRTLAQQTMADSEEVEQFPAVNERNARVVPKAVADVQTRGSVSYRTHSLGSSDIARMEDGRLSWSYPIEPEGTRNKLVEHQRGVVMTDMTSIDNREIQAHDDTEFTYGEGMALHRSSEWHLEKTDYNAEYRDDAVEFTHDGEPYMAYPKTGHEWHLTPIPHTTPTWKGVALVHPDGTIEHLSPEAAQESKILEGQRLYPLYNTEQEMKSLGHRNGIVNQMAIVGEHDGEVEVASMPSGAGNSQPFVIDLADEQMVYVTAMEPYGESTRGLDEVWFADAQTGKHYYYGTGDETLTGPERAMGIVRSSDTQTGWGDDFEVIEPVPVTVDDELWWHSKVVPTDKTDVSRNVFVNAHTGEAIQIYDDETVAEFLAGEDPEEVEEVTKEQTEDEPKIAYYVVVIGEDGNEIDRIPIEEGQDVNLVQENSTSGGGNESDG